LPERVRAVRVVDQVSLAELSSAIERISEFQKLIQERLRSGLDYGIIPGTAIKTLLKPGAEKICMLLGLRSEFEIMDATRDFESGFFQYQVKCKLYWGETLITEGMGAANTRETKYRSRDAYTLDNTALKMGKKRALVDSALMVGSCLRVSPPTFARASGPPARERDQHVRSIAVTPKSQDRAEYGVAHRSCLSPYATTHPIVIANSALA